MALISTEESKGTLEKYAGLWNKIRFIIISKANNLVNYDDKYMEIKYNLDDDLSLKKTLELYYMLIVVRSCFRESKGYYPQFFLDEYLHKL